MRALATWSGAIAGLLGGFAVFIVAHAQLIDPQWFVGTFAHAPALWLYEEGPNPYSCAVMGEIASVLLTVFVSKVSKPLPKAHLDLMFNEPADA